MRRISCIASFLGALCIFFWFHPSESRADGLPAATSDQLGSVHFPTSCSAEVQPAIEKGVALLHSFQYTESEKLFAEASAREPKCATAYWGKAMALYHQLWDFPDDKTLSEGWKDLEKAQKLPSTNAREHGFINAAAAFFQHISKMTHNARTAAYSAVLEHIYLQYPDDVEVAAFYALSLVSLADQDVDATANLTKAIAILDPLLRSYPDHPGIAHYLIHAADRPEFAAQGLEAARRYAAIAPDSSHALHMPSHIFVRLGLWQDSIASNLAAESSAAHAAEMHLSESHYQTHPMAFLNYSYLQSGQEAKAREVIEHVEHVVGASEDDKAEHRSYLSAQTAIELRRWKDAANLPVSGVRKKWEDTAYWARAIGAARSGDANGAEAAVHELSRMVDERQKRSQKKGYAVSSGKAVDLQEAEAWLAFANGKSVEALAELHSASDQEDKNGGNSTSIPAREMLADMLLELKRPTEALAEYSTDLKNAPNRFDALLGAARSAQALGNSAQAQSFYSKLAEICSPAADRPELGEVKTFLAQK